MLNRVLTTVHRYEMLSTGLRIGVAVSGGADSVCLLEVLVELAPRYGLELQVLHVNHGLRGEESRCDAEFVAALADRLGLVCRIREAPVAAGAGAENLEQAARKLRLACFREAIASGEVDRVALGHTRSDQAETVLFRLLRGAGSAGLAGIRPRTTEGLIRPLIEVGREEVRGWLRERGIVWREDSSNASLEFARNRLRHQLLPQLTREWNPAIEATLAQTAEWALAEEAWWQAETDRLAAANLRASEDGGVLLNVEGLAALPLAAARRLVRRAMEVAKGDLRAIDFGHVSRVLDLVGGPEGGRAQAPGLEICRSFEWIRLAAPVAATPYRLAAPVPGLIPVPGTGFLVSLELIEKSETSDPEDSVYNDVMACLDCKRLSGSLELRNWQPGDRYQPIGASGREKVKNLFQQMRVPLWERGQWPVLTDSRGIVWARRFGAAVECAAGPGSQRVLRVQEVTAR